MWNPFKNKKKKSILGRLKSAMRSFHASASHHTRKNIKIDHHRTRAGRRARHVYAVSSVLILIATTILWSVLSAEVHSGNADQLIDPYLFESWSVFNAATFPGAHTFLLKWPIFFLVAFFDLSLAGIAVATVVVALVTVLSLAFILHRIERRPMVFGTICLLLALVLLLIPAQPYAGALLPLNMGMLATRNLEYIVYIVALILVVRTERLASWSFVLSLALLALLFASDRLFLGISLGGALLMFVFYWGVRNKHLLALSVHWLFMTVISALVAMLVVTGITMSGLTHIASEGGSNPYGFVNNIKDAMLGIAHAITGLATNLGVNPTYDVTILKDIPGRLLTQVLSWSIIAYAIAAMGIFYGFKLTWRLFRSTIPFLSKVKPPKEPQLARFLSVLLVFSTLASIGVFIISKHYYPVDARYLTIILFTFFIVIATELRVYRLYPLPLLGIGTILAIGISVAGFSFIHIQENEIKVAAPVRDRNHAIAQVLERHPVDALVADYWRAVPIRSIAPSLQVVPLSNCVTPAEALSSGAWGIDMKKHSFAYLLSLEKSSTNFPNCTVAQVLKAYGKPSSSLVLKGQISNPEELLLFYDHGISEHSAKDLDSTLPLTSTVLPVSTGDLAIEACEGATIMNIVAHPDDDLLFMNPDIIDSIKGNDCVRTVYLTAGDSGKGSSYWIGRELGTEAAYDVMLGKSHRWTQSVVQLGAHQYVTIANPRDNPRVSLIFFNLPDGGIDGGGFQANGMASLSKLYRGELGILKSADNQSQYSASQLTSSLQKLMEIYQVAEIRNQVDMPDALYKDHSDHITGGLFSEDALNAYNETLPVGVNIISRRYFGYPIHGLDANVAGENLAIKQAAFFAYAKHDGGVCHNVDECAANTAYGFYLERQYSE